MAKWWVLLDKIFRHQALLLAPNLSKVWYRVDNHLDSKPLQGERIQLKLLQQRQHKVNCRQDLLPNKLSKQVNQELSKLLNLWQFNLESKVPHLEVQVRGLREYRLVVLHWPLDLGRTIESQKEQGPRMLISNLRVLQKRKARKEAAQEERPLKWMRVRMRAQLHQLRLILHRKQRDQRRGLLRQLGSNLQ